MFTFQLQQYQSQGQSTSYLQLTNQLQLGFVSPRLQELCGYYSNRLSYEEVAQLAQRVTGSEMVLSDQSVWRIVQNQAQTLSQQFQQSVEATLVQTPLPVIQVNSQIDLYHPEAPEILLFDDAIQVKGQSATRNSRAKAASENSPEQASDLKAPAVLTDIVMLQKPTGDFEYLTTPIERAGKSTLSLATMVQAKVVQIYGQEAAPLNIVAITDGARAIRRRLLALFGVAVVSILDWYHLCQKVRNLMSMIAFHRNEKAAHLKFLVPQLWRGKTSAALDYLRTQVTARHQDKLQELIGYLEKHQAEIIDYNRRSRAGKTIGSGRMEKGVDLVIGRRQKKKAMSWRPKGSKALALLKIAELNGQWQQLWFPVQTA